MAEVKLKRVRLFRVKMNDMGMLPKGWPEGMITGMTEEELTQLELNPHIRACFEEVEVVPRAPEVPSAKK